MEVDRVNAEFLGESLGKTFKAHTPYYDTGHTM